MFFYLFFVYSQMCFSCYETSFLITKFPLQQCTPQIFLKQKLFIYSLRSISDVWYCDSRVSGLSIFTSTAPSLFLYSLNSGRYSIWAFTAVTAAKVYQSMEKKIIQITNGCLFFFLILSHLPKYQSITIIYIFIHFACKFFSVWDWRTEWNLIYYIILQKYL